MQQGPNTVTISPANTYTGPTSILGGTLIVSTLTNGAANSPIGSSSNAAANLGPERRHPAIYRRGHQHHPPVHLGHRSFGWYPGRLSAGTVGLTNTGAVVFTGAVHAAL